MKTIQPDNEDHYHEDSEEDFSKVLLSGKTLFLFGEINPNSTGNFLAAFQEADSKPGLIKINICSQGGWVEGGMCMYDTIRSSKNKVLTIACGAVYSSAVLPFEAGDIRAMQKSSRLFLHDMSITMMDATLKTVKSVTSETQRLYKLYCNYISERTGLSLVRVDAMLQEDTYLSSEDCLELGFTDAVIDHLNVDEKYSVPVKKVKAKKGKK